MEYGDYIEGSLWQRDLDCMAKLSYSTRESGMSLRSEGDKHYCLLTVLSIIEEEVGEEECSLSQRQKSASSLMGRKDVDSRNQDANIVMCARDMEKQVMAKHHAPRIIEERFSGQSLDIYGIICGILIQI